MYLCGFIPLTWQNFLVLQEAGERVSPGQKSTRWRPSKLISSTIFQCSVSQRFSQLRY